MRQFSAIRQQLLVQAQWSLFTLAAFLAALMLAWQVLASVNFLYPLWYESIDIDRTIATYGPRNRYRHQFESTTKAERERLFAAIVTAIHDQGRGLDNLNYHDPTGRVIAKLLTPPEITHLQDVAHLVATLQRIGWSAWLALPVLLLLAARQRLPLPSIGRLLATAAGALFGVAGLILLIGPVRVFYRLHTWIFPAGHAWFFYYEDSLMTMLMQAPVIFGYIALALAALSLLLFPGLLWLLGRGYRYSIRPRPF